MNYTSTKLGNEISINPILLYNQINPDIANIDEIDTLLFTIHLIH